MCRQPSSLPYEKVAGLAIQNPAWVVAHAKIRKGRPGCTVSDDFHESYIALGSPRLRDHHADRRPSLLPTTPLCSAALAVSELIRRLLRTNPAEFVQRSRLNSADASHRNPQPPGSVGICPHFAVGEPEPKLQYASIKIIEPEQQLPHLHGFGQGCLQLVARVQALQSGTIDKLQGARPLV